MKAPSLLLLILLSTLSLQAQSLEFFGFSGYTFADQFPITGGAAKIFDGHTYGASLTYAINPAYSVEVQYSRQNTDATAVSVFQSLDIDEPLSVNYMTAGSHRLFPFATNGVAFSGLKLGAVWFASDQDAFETIVRFAAGVSGGAKYFFTDNVGLRVQANLFFPISDVGANLWWSPGGGTSVGVSSFTPIVQFGFTGGVVLRIPTE